jgi:hypothetical protein
MFDEKYAPVSRLEHLHQISYIASPIIALREYPKIKLGYRNLLLQQIT